MHASSYEKCGKFVSGYLNAIQPLKILDVGSSGHTGTYKELFNNPLWTYEGTDIHPGPNVDFVMAQYIIPVERDTYDVVISGQTMEHVEYFWLWIKELVRVLKPGGILFLTTPGSGPIHRDPIDCWRFHVDGMYVLAKWAELHVLESYMTQENDWWDCVLIATK